jgi:hypothetical protein
MSLRCEEDSYLIFNSSFFCLFCSDHGLFVMLLFIVLVYQTTENFCLSLLQSMFLDECLLLRFLNLPLCCNVFAFVKISLLVNLYCSSYTVPEREMLDIIILSNIQSTRQTWHIQLTLGVILVYQKKFNGWFGMLRQHYKTTVR